MPTPETALIDTLNALQTATAAATQVGACTSETARASFTRDADRALAFVGDCIERLAKTTADTPTLFGRNVGDGLATERAEAATAVNILRLLVNGGEGQPALLTLSDAGVAGPFLEAMPGHLKLPLALNELALIEALKKGPSDG